MSSSSTRVGATLVGMAMGVATLAAASGPAVSAAAGTSAEGGQPPVAAPVVGGEEVVSVQAEDVEFTGDGRGLPAKVVVGWGGRVTAVWYRPDAEVGYGGGRLYASVREDGGTWSEPVALSEPFPYPSGRRFDAAAGASSSVTVVWSARVDGSNQIFESHREATGGSSPVVLDRGIEPLVTMDGRGEATVLWQRGGIRVATRSAAGHWSTPRRFTTTGGWTPAELATNRAGDKAAVWRQDQGLRAAYRDRTSVEWPRAVTVPGKYFEQVALAVDRKGRALAAWSTPRAVWWTRRSLTGHWSPARKIAGDVGQIGEWGWMDLTVNKQGHGLLRWVAQVYDTYVARYRPGHGFQKARRLGPSFEAEGSPALTGVGTAAVAGQTGFQVAYRWQAPGEDWSALTSLGSAQAVNDVGTRERTMAVLFQREGLRVRIIDL